MSLRFIRSGAAGLAALVLLMAVGCGSGGDTNSSTTTGGKSAERTTNNLTAPTDNGAAPKATKKDGSPIVMGFSQIGAESGWRTANTESIQSEAKARGIDLKFSDAQGKQENQIKAIKSFIEQGVDVIAFSPVVETGWGPVLQEAKKAGIPVIVSDRRPDVPDDLYVTFLGSDFIQEGERAAEWLAKATNGKATIAELTGTPGSAPANDRAKGFRNVLAKYPNMKIVFSQTGDFRRDNGKQVMEALLKSPQGSQITALFAHNDDMAIGAIQAIKAAGKKPGKDIMVVSIDGIKDGLQALKDGDENYIVECNPLLGPMLMDSVVATLNGKTLPKRQLMKDEAFDQTAAIKALPTRKY
ncbi:MAG TPA: ABC transporter substrate-binding protein [Fimbriimonadaceae bacterium]|nr:ABC transporter substrate-binding protein [Fimbriimonadaceae bacterium]